MKPSPQNLQQVLDWRLCIGCGACVAACTEGSAALTWNPELGYRPELGEVCASCTDCLPFCPGAGVSSPDGAGRGPETADFGPARFVWEGWAREMEVRSRGSSGGVLTALALYAVEQAGYAGVIQTGMAAEDPTRNVTRIARTRSEILAGAGSRYNSSAPVAALRSLREESETFLFIGKPCDAAAVSAMRRRIPWVRERIGMVATFFCAGTPAPEGTRQLVRELGEDPGALTELHYRGEGWPGDFRFKRERSEDGWTRLSYQESWSYLTKFRPLRCHLCPDGTGEVADVACGDAWHRYDPGRRDPGRSLILARTEAGEAFIQAAARTGYLELRAATRSDVVLAQPSLLSRRRELWGRLWALRLMGIPVPQYEGFHLRELWRTLPRLRRLRTLLGTLRRALLRGWYRRRA